MLPLLTVVVCGAFETLQGQGRDLQEVHHRVVLDRHCRDGSGNGSLRRRPLAAAAAAEAAGQAQSRRSSSAECGTGRITSALARPCWRAVTDTFVPLQWDVLMEGVGYSTDSPMIRLLRVVKVLQPIM